MPRPTVSACPCDVLPHFPPGRRAEVIPGTCNALYIGAAYMGKQGTRKTWGRNGALRPTWLHPGACLPTWCYLATFSRPTYLFCKLQDSKNGTKQRKLHLKTKIFAEKFAGSKICSYLCIVRNKKLIGLDGFTDYL